MIEEYPRGSKWLVLVSLASLSFFLLFKLSTLSFSSLHLEVIFILAFLISLLFRRSWQLKNDMAIKLLLLGCLLPLLSFLINYILNKELAVEYFEFDKLVKLMGFVSIGFWLGGTLKNIYTFLIIVLLGLVVALFNVDVIQAFKSIFAGKRVDFDIQNAQHTAMFFGLAIIAFISFYKDLIFSKFSKPLIVFLSLLYISGLVLVSTVFAGAQTRAAVLAMDAIFVFSLIHFFVHWLRKSCQKSIAMLFVVYFLLSSVALFSLTNSVLHKRGSETLVTEKLVTGNMDNIPMTSFGVRLNSWIEASKWIKEKPLQGWGGGVRGYVMQQSNFSEAFKKHYGHFHNSYVEFTLAYGLIGLFYIFFIYFWVNRKIYLLSIKNPQFSGVWYFTLYGSLFMGIINIVESFVFFRTGVYATAILLAPAYTLYLADVYARFNPKREHLL